jgi:hypothetical protein
MLKKQSVTMQTGFIWLGIRGRGEKGNEILGPVNSRESFQQLDDY